MNWRAPFWRRVWIWLSYRPWVLRTRFRWWRTGECGNACGWVDPYGWVPEADCPIHDGGHFTWDCEGNRLVIGSEVELWTTRDEDGYHPDPKLDRRDWGYHERTTVAALAGPHVVVSESGGYWPTRWVRLLPEDTP